MRFTCHLTPELVVGQCEQPLQVLCDEFGMFQKLLHLSRRAVLWWRFVRHETALILPDRVLVWDMKHRFDCENLERRVISGAAVFVTHQRGQRVLFPQRAGLGHLLLVQWHSGTGHGFSLSSLIYQVIKTQRNSKHTLLLFITHFSVLLGVQRFIFLYLLKYCTCSITELKLC